MAHGLDMEIQFLPGVGPKRAELLRKELAVETVGDLLRLYPFRYIDKTSITRICDARPDMAYLQIRAKVTRTDLYGAKGAMDPGTSDAPKFNMIKRMSVWVSDGSGDMEMVFFKGIKWMYGRLKPGAEFIFFGKPTAFNGRMNIVHPEVDDAPP
jgi:ATP-dependent DNA helicase RecG